MFEQRPQTQTSEAGQEPDPYELIKPIEDLGPVTYDPSEDEISKKKAECQSVKKQIETLLADHFSEKSGSNRYLDAKSYLKGRLHAVNYTLERIERIHG